MSTGPVSPTPPPGPVAPNPPVPGPRTDTDAFDLHCWVAPGGQLCGCTASSTEALLPFQQAGPAGRGTPLALQFLPAQSDSAPGSLLLRACPLNGAAMPPRAEPCPAGAVEAVLRAEPTWAAWDANGCTLLKVTPTGIQGAPSVPVGDALPGRYSHDPAAPVYGLRVNAL